MVGFIFGGNTGETPESLKRKRELIEQMMTGQRTPQNWGEGVGALLTGIASGIQRRRLDKTETEGRASATSMMDKIKGLITGTNPDIPMFGGGSAGNIPSPGAAGELAATTPGGGSSYRNAIASIESAGSGDYAAVGPRHPKMGRALGRYQIMESNIGPWSKEALGREVTADEFMADPKLQDAIFDNKFGSYVERFGPEGAAQAWFGGPGGVGKTNRKDSLGTSVGGYGQKFMKALGPGGGQDVAAGTPEAAFSAVMPELGGGQSLSDEVAAYRQTPEYSQQFPGKQQQGFDTGRFGDPAAMQPAQGMGGLQSALAGQQHAAGQQAIQNQTQAGNNIPQEFQGSQQLMNAQGGMMPALMGGQPASADQIAQARQMGQQQGGQQQQMGQEQGMSGPSLQELMQLASHPWLSQEQRAIANTLLEQKLQEQQSAREEQQWRGRQDYEQRLKQQDPSYQLEQDYRRAQLDKMQREASGGGTPEFGLNPQYGVDRDGNPVLVQIGKDGKAVQTAMPDGVSLSKEPIKLDAGTHWVLLDPITRQPVGQIPKENRKAARETAIGKGEGEGMNEASFALPGARAMAGDIGKQIKSLKEDKYLDNMLGPLDSRLPNFSADAARVQGKMDKLSGGAFLQGRELLKGGGAITDFESKKAEQAFARLNAAQSREDYRDALDEFEYWVRSGVTKLEQQAAGAGGVSQGGGAAQPGGVDYRSRYGLE